VDSLDGHVGSASIGSLAGLRSAARASDGRSARAGPICSRRRRLLVDEQSAVPIESNLVRNGVLVSHTTFAYEQAASGVLVRRGVRHEGLVSGQRVITEVSYGDIRLDQNGGR
jgi:hypothetical protein